MRRMLIMNDLVQGGGVEKVLYNMVKYFSPFYDIHLLTIYNDNKVHDIYPNIKHVYIHNNMDNRNLAKKVFDRVKKLFFIFCYTRLIKFDIAIAIKEGPSMQLIAQTDVPVKIAWIHTDFNRLHWTKDYFKKESELDCMRKFKYVLCVSNLILKSVIKYVGDPGNLIQVINPVDEEEIIAKSKEIVEDWRKPEGKLLFVSVGRLVGEKGYERLLECCLRLNEASFNYELWIIGEGNRMEIIKEFICKHNLYNIKLLGKRENPYKYMKMADWFVCPSFCEGSSLVILESIILKLPVITTDNLGACEIFNIETHGMIVENSSQGIYAGMSKALANPQLCEFYKNRMMTDNTHFSFPEIMNRIERLIS